MGTARWLPANHLTQWLISRGEAVVDIPSTATARVRGTLPWWAVGRTTASTRIHIVAVTQARTPSSDGYAYHQRKMAEGKTSREAVRCLERHVATRLWRTMRDDHIVSLDDLVDTA